MPTIHLLFKKEEIDAVKMKENKVAVILDILLATSTITACLYGGAKRIIAVRHKEEALEEIKHLKKGSFCLVGEYEGKTIEGFLDPTPRQLEKIIKGKTVVLSTTNGTVAIRKAACAKQVYIASLLNGSAIAKHIAFAHQKETIIVVCAGSQHQFCLEDFYGAGYFIDQLVSASSGHWELTDAAKAALLFFKSSEAPTAILKASKVGEMLIQHGFEEEITFISRLGIMPIVPYVCDGNMMIKTVQGWRDER